MSEHRLPDPDLIVTECCICQQAFSEDAWQNRHWLHEEGCQNFFHLSQGEPCDCALDVHAEHCPVCEPSAAAKIEADAYAQLDEMLLDKEREPNEPIVNEYYPDETPEPEVLPNSVNIPVKLPSGNYWQVTPTSGYRNNGDGTWSFMRRGQPTGQTASDEVVASIFDHWMNPQRSDIGKYRKTGDVYAIGHRDGLVID